MKTAYKIFLMTGCFSCILSGCFNHQAKYQAGQSTEAREKLPSSSPLISVEQSIPRKSNEYTITDLGTLGGIRIWPHAINNLSQIVGDAETGNNVFHAFLWQQGYLTDLGAYPDDFNPIPHSAVASRTTATSGAASINNKAQIVGQSEPNGEMQGGSFHYQAMLWENGKISDLGTLLYPNSTANKINDRGQIIGDVVDKDNLPLTRTYRTRPFLFQNSRLRLLDLAPESVGLNNSGEIVGSSLTVPYSLVMINGNGKQRRLAGFMTDKHIFRTLINDRDQIVVVTTDYQDESSDGYKFFPVYTILWQHGKAVKMNGLKSYPVAEAKSINAHGSIVGEARQNYAGKDVIPSAAVLWRQGAPDDLNNDIPKGTGWMLQHAEGINDAGQITGWGELHGEERAFLLTPTR